MKQIEMNLEIGGNADDFLSGVDFITPAKKYETRSSVIDVVITPSAVKEAGKKDRVTLRVTNAVADKVFPSGRGIFGIYKNRVILKDCPEGYKVSDNGSKTTKVLLATVDSAETWFPFAGEYELKQDEFYGFWYVEKKGE